MYILGGAGAGKSTFTAELVELLGAEYGPLEELAALPNKKNIVTLRGHRLAGDGMYLGVKRDSFPGTDGLDRATSPVGEHWLRESGNLPAYIVAEGATLATTRFLTALEDCTDFLLLHLHVDPAEAERRFAQRGSNQAASFVEATRTRSANRAREAADRGTTVLTVNTGDPPSWELALDLAAHHLQR